MSMMCIGFEPERFAPWNLIPEGLIVQIDQGKLQSSFTFLIIFFLAAGQLVFSWAYMKETKGKSLEEIEDLWK